MCGIVGYIGRQACVPILMGGLGQVEYRGYDSAGIAVITPTGSVKVHRRAGKLGTLAESLPKRLAGRVGIGHTRWATHGAPTDTNAHPHVDTSGRVAIVHNGIIENAAELRRGLEADGVVFASETDSECFAHLIAAALKPGVALEDAVRHVLANIEGTYGLLVVSADQPDRIVVARRGSPIVIGIGDREMLVASDIAALVRSTRQVVALADGEMAVLSADGYRTFALEGTPTQQRPFTVDWDPSDFTLDGHPHFMHKEIAEQPAAISRSLLGRIDERHATAKLGGIDLDARTALAIRRVVLLGCGTAYYAGMAGAHLIEDISRIPATAEPAAEFGYRNPVIERDALYIALSQSGETADTLEAVQEIKRRGGRVIALVNVVGSTIARECDGIYLHSGPEISVASTKAFTSMLAALSLLALHLGRVRDLGPGRAGHLIDGLRALPDAIASIIDDEAHIQSIAERYAASESLFFIGRHRGYPIALEGAQKLKEISYIHAEAYPASELKHGPLALISPDFPSVVLIPDDDLVEKNVSTIHQIKARGGPVIGVVQDRGAAANDASIVAGEPLLDEVIRIPTCAPELAPILLTIPLQLLAYHAAIALERDVDQPRNLAKSVTVA
jgi:glucosamine--fructose-6-phosphate aminotransferase (isomerizing)